MEILLDTTQQTIQNCVTMLENPILADTAPAKIFDSFLKTYVRQTKELLKTYHSKTAAVDMGREEIKGYLSENLSVATSLDDDLQDF